MGIDIKTITLKSSSVKRYYSMQNDHTLDMTDIIIAVREVSPNPRVPVEVDTDLRLPGEELTSSGIFVKGSYKPESLNAYGVDSNITMPIKITEEDLKVEGFNLSHKVSMIKSEFGISKFKICLYSDNLDNLRQIWEYIPENTELSSMDIRFPKNITLALHLAKDGIDIAPYVAELDYLIATGSLSGKHLLAVKNKIKAEVDGGKRTIQYLSTVRTQTAKWLTLVLTQECSVSPVHITSYVTDYLDLEAGYPINKLSMAERVRYVSKLPKTVGYIGKTPDLLCQFEITAPVLPDPTLVFDMNAGKLVDVDKEKFSISKIAIKDLRAIFPESAKNWFRDNAGSSKSLATSASGDYEVDCKLSAMFVEMARQSPLRNNYITLHNTLLAQVDNKPYLIHYSEPFGLIGNLVSEFFGAQPFVVKETEFKHLIDSKFAASFQQVHGLVASATKTTSRDSYNKLMEKLPQTLAAPVPVSMQMCMDLVSYDVNDMSYYDTYLRRAKSLFPVVYHEDVEESKTDTVFDYISLESILADPVGSSITSFGTLQNESSSTIPVSIDSFKGVRLLE